MLKASVRYSIKVVDKERRGLVAATYSIERDKLVPFLIGLITSACEFMVDVGELSTTEELQAALNEVSSWCGGLCIDETNVGWVDAMP